MADQESQPSRAPSRAEQRMAAVAKLKRAASLPRMKDGRRPPMHVEAVSEGEKSQLADDDRTVVSEEEKTKSDVEIEQNNYSPSQTATPQDTDDGVRVEKERTPELDNNHSPQPTPQTEETKNDHEADGEVLDTELEERPMSPTRKKRRSRSRSRSRGSKDFKGKFKVSSPTLHLGGDSSQDEMPPFPSPIALPMVPPLASPVPHFPFLQHNRLLRSPTPLPPEMALLYPGTSPPTPLPTLEDLQKGLMRSNSVGHSNVGRRLAMHKLTGGTETYDAPSPSPTPPPFTNKLSRNNTVSGGERIAARQNMLSRLGTRVREADAEAASGTEDRSGPSPIPAKRRRRRSRRASQSAANNANPAVSDSDITSTDYNTPALPSTPLPISYDHYAELRAHSVTPNHLTGSRTQSVERPFHSATAPTSNVAEGEKSRPEHHRRRSVLIEDPDPEDPEPLPLQTRHQPPTPSTPQKSFQAADTLRTHASNTPSNSSDSAPSSAVGVPVFLNHRAPSRNEAFPSSPFTIPLEERPFSASDEEEEERVIYPATTARPRTPYGNAVEVVDREISWIASPVLEIRMPIDDDEDEDDDLLDENHEETYNIIPIDPDGDETPLSADEAFVETWPRVSTSSKSILVESEIPPEPTTYDPTSLSSLNHLSQSSSISQTADEPASPQFFPQRLSVASRIHSAGDRSPVGGDFADWEPSADSPKRAEASSSAWEKVITFVRSGSSTGRRSRTNSISARERRDNTDSSISRESGASLSGKFEALPSGQQPQAPPLMLSPSASASILSLAPPGPPRANASPIPPASSADRSKYQHAKLFPFPGMIKLEEERRAKANTPLPTPSSPDASMQFDEPNAPSLQYSFSGSSSQTADGRDRRLSHQYSDSRLVTKYGSDYTPAKHSVPDYIDIPPSSPNNGGYNLKLPMTLPGVKQWLKNSKKKNVSPVASASGSVSFGTLPVLDSPSPPITNKKPSLSDIFAKRPNELANDWEDAGTTPTNVTLNRSAGNNAFDGVRTVEVSYENEHTPRAPPSVPLEPNTNDDSSCKSPIEPSTSSRITSATPDPSSVSDYPAATPSESSTTSSESSLHVHQGSYVLEMLEENLNRSSKGPMWTSAIEDPPRKLVLSSPVLQVVDQNTVKDRFLFLFSDLLVIAKPAPTDPHDSASDPFKLTVPDKKYSVKSVVQMQKLRFCADRLEAASKSALGPRNPLIQSFTAEFAVNPDQAITSLFAKSNQKLDLALLGHLLFKTLDLDRSRLGEYLSRRASKAALKAYLGCFGFAGLRVDVALRVFLHSLNLTQHTHTDGSLEYLLDSFATRWYEANAKFVPYDKDMAVQLVWSLVQLNNRLHGPIADETGPTDRIQRTVTTKEFQDAFHHYDTRYLVSDDALQELYRSIFQEHLCQALPSITNSQEVAITIKRPIPTRLTYKAQSEPIVFRLPQPDPNFTIELYGQDLIFDPPILHFSRSSEASFRVIGTSLGPKTVTMCRSGPNAIKYSGLPLSHSIVVERAFMKNTFQIAFINQAGLKRRYMFSVDDPIIRNEWATCLRRQIDATNASSANGTSSLIASRFHQASQKIAFKVLQDTLLGVISRSGSVIGHRVNGSASTQSSLGSSLHGSPYGIPPLHVRSRSRSRIYRREELELSRSQNSSGDSNEYGFSHSSTPDQRIDGTLWTSRELEMYCQQNSAISVVLSILQVGTVDKNTTS